MAGNVVEGGVVIARWFSYRSKRFYVYNVALESGTTPTDAPYGSWATTTDPTGSTESFYSDGTKWISNSTVGGGGGGSSSGIFSPDAKPNINLLAQTDYFEDPASNKGLPFQETLQDFNISNGRAKFNIKPSASTKLTGRTYTLPEGDCTIITKVSVPTADLDITAAGIGLFQDAEANPNTSDVITFWFTRFTAANATGLRYQVYSDYQTYNTDIQITSATDTNAYVPVYLKLSRSGTTWIASYSFSGRVWTALVTAATEGTYFKPKQFGLITTNISSGVTVELDFEFLYYIDAANAPLPGAEIGKTSSSGVFNRLICLGDSITAGYGVSYLDTYVNRLAQLSNGASIHSDARVIRPDNGDQEWIFLNKGVNGYTGQDVITKSLPTTLARRDTDLVKDWVLVYIGTNDLANGDSAAVAYTRLTTIITTLKAAGFKVLVCTIIDRDGTVGFDAARITYNGLIISNLAGADQVINLYGVTQLQDASNSTYFSDGIHPTAIGQNLIAGTIILTL